MSSEKDASINQESSKSDESSSNDKADGSASIWKSKVTENRDKILLFIGAIITTSATCIHYIIVQLGYTTIGFTLDDSWIHLEYARSVFEGRPWQYSHGYPSTGSTSPLWSIVLSGLFFFTSETVALVWGVMIVSLVFYVLSSYIIGWFVMKLSGKEIFGYVAMVVFAIVPSNTWLILSGMEYPLFLFLLLLPLYILDRPEPQFDVILGIVAGLTFLARPEGILLALIAFPIRIAQHISRREINRRILLSLTLMIVSAGLVVLPWILYCYSVTGYPLPDTFYAKVHAVTAFEVEAWNIFWSIFIGTMPFLIMGMLLGVLTLLKQKPYVWIFGIALTLLYRFTMPYQALINNSRYLTPIFAFLAVTCIAGFAIFYNEIMTSKPPKKPRIFRYTLAAVIIVIVIIPSIPLYMRQSEVFGIAAKNINEMQVDIGYWVKENTPENATIAMCDVGAIRFISNRTIVDICGLVTPDITHGNFSSFELRDYLESRQIDYLIIFG
ncbi:MAG: hypothetical protein ACFFD3_04490, partial [Candidatus Thorarchaeota archaeon]